MDSRESSSAVQSGNRDGSTEEDGHLSVTAGLAKDAALLFQTRRFNECLAILNQLLEKKEDDPKVLHNIAVTEYFRDGCSDPRKLLEVLNTVKKRSNDLAHASGEQVDFISSVGAGVASGSKGSNTAHQFATPNATRFSYADEIDTSIALLNTAVILYHLHEYSNALSVLEPLYQNIEPIDETTALHICLLLLDIVLALHDASKAADVIQYLEKAFGFGFSINQGDNGSTTQHQPSNQATKVPIPPANLAAVDASNQDYGVVANSSETTLARTLSDDAIDYENLLSNLSRPATLAISNDRAPPAVDLKLKLHLYKVRLLLLTRNLKAAKREVKMAMNIARGRDSSTALLLKSQLEYARGNHRKSVKLLMTSSNRTESGMPSMFFNNLGCIYHQLRKHHTSTLFFSKALKSSSSLRSERPLRLSTFSQDKSLLIVYNCGLQHLACGKPVVAARCFLKASLVFYNRPLLWLRLAECCLMALEKGLLKPTDSEEVKIHVVGNGKWRQLIVGETTSRSRHLDSVKEDGLSIDGQHVLSMPFARQCLINALHQLNNHGSERTKAVASAHTLEEDGLSSAESAGIKNSNHKNVASGDMKASNATGVAAHAGANGDPKEAKMGPSSNTTIQSSVSAYDDMCCKETLMIKQAVFADLAFVELQMENPLKALSYAKSLLELPDCSKIYTFHGHVYAAESLCRLNRPKEAAEHLLVYVLGGNTVQLPYSDQDCDQWRCEKGGDGEELNSLAPAKNCTGGGFSDESQSMMFLMSEEASGVLYVNLAAMSAMQGDLEQAHRFATEALTKIPTNPSTVLAVVYADLLLGKTQEALARLRQSSHVRFLPSNVTLNSS